MEKPIIGIPVYRDHESLEAMIQSLRASTIFFERIVIVESDGDMDYWAEWTHEDFQIIHTGREGPLKAYNKLFEIARNENKDLLITQTDVMFPRLYNRDWLEIMADKAQDPRIGLVVPVNGGGTSGPTYLDKLPWVGGWCTYISKKCWEVFQGYDNNYPMGWGVDIDMTYQIMQKYGIYMVDYWVDHHQMNNRSHETSPDAERTKQEAATYFRSKWKL